MEAYIGARNYIVTNKALESLSHFFLQHNIFTTLNLPIYPSSPRSPFTPRMPWLPVAPVAPVDPLLRCQMGIISWDFG